MLTIWLLIVIYNLDNTHRIFTYEYSTENRCEIERRILINKAKTNPKIKNLTVKCLEINKKVDVKMTTDKYDNKENFQTLKPKIILKTGFDHKIISYYTTTELSRKIGKLSREGWVCQGSVVISIVEKKNLYLQAMIRNY